MGLRHHSLIAGRSPNYCIKFFYPNLALPWSTSRRALRIGAVSRPHWDRRHFSAATQAAAPHYRRCCRRRAPSAPRYIRRRAGPLRDSLVSSCAEHTSWTFRRSAALLPRVTKTQATCSLPGPRE
ncbi:unnamed protein product [Trichogramma brassicae]|uniref:Uncharacterized protein n=1 Tax=Trichogramma brassicae TaxID=86971 RepID=A0A6H5HW48_9HYME|nr:unnamed protein product [Trichogramma brassicae]